MKHTFIVLLLFVSLFDLSAQTHSPRTVANSPEQQLAGFTVPEGFVIELVASEQDGVINPIDLTFDDAGRLWTQTATMYPLDPIADIKWNDLLDLMNDSEAQRNHPNFKRILDLYQGKTKGDDKILILSDFYGSSKAKAVVWADGLTIPQSILPYKDGAYVAQGSELFFLQDSDKDGKADKRDPLFTGFGFTDTHTMAHTLIRAPNGWIHFSHGALNKGEVTSLKSNQKLRLDYSKIGRFSVDGKSMEIVSSGLNNIWGFQLRSTGEWYGSEANDLGFSVAPMEPGTGFPGIGSERIRTYQPWMPPLHDFRVGGTGISGTAFADDTEGSFPEEWRDVAFLANPITSAINAVRIIRHPDGSVTSEHLPDLLTSKDDWFRPVNMEFGPDGALYIADWYNKIISHNELPTTHPDRDKSHGRIWRIRHVSQKPRTITNFYEVKTKDLVAHLKSPSLWAKRAAWHQISDRPQNQTKWLIKDLVALAADPAQTETTRIHALWSLESLKHYDPRLVESLLKSPLNHLRREAVRSLASYSISASEAVNKLGSLLEDSNPAVRSQVLRTWSETGLVDSDMIHLLVKAAKPELPGNEMGGSYERKFERYLVRMALEKYPEELKDYLNSSLVHNVPKENVLWVIQALPPQDKIAAFLKWWPIVNPQKLDEYTFISIAQMLDNREIYRTVEPVFKAPNNALDLLQLALKNQAQVQSKELASLLHSPIMTLLKRDDEEEQNVALDAVGRFNISGVKDLVVSFVSDRTSDKTLSLALKALENDPAVNQAVFQKVFEDKNYGFDRRASALNSLARADKAKGEGALKAWVQDLNIVQKQELVRILSGSKEGVGLLLAAYEQKLLDISAFDISSAEKVHQTNRMDLRGLAILEGAKKMMEEEKSIFQQRLTKYVAIGEQKVGDPIKGKSLFQTCLMCHAVGNQGQNIAPALDGSANRDLEALITAIIDPDAAVESNYAVYRITKKDGGNVEGYLVNKDNRGTTLAFMGGSRVFISSEDIRSEGFLGGRSFMMRGLIDSYSDEQVADLISYIKTLK